MTDTITVPTVTSVPLNKLTLWKGNVRKTGVADALQELTASIEAHGLLQALVVRRAKKGFEIIAGQRRYLALSQLAKQGRLEKTAPVPCQIARQEVDAKEISLTENVVRVQMHPADQFGAFDALAKDGLSAQDIAARFGVSDSIVKKRLALGRVSPVLLTLYRDGEIDLETLSAFTLTDDHDEQERVWSTLPAYHRGASSIRHALTKQDIPASDKRVRFVTVDAYEAAGGVTRRDLFSEGEHGVYLLSGALLDRLAGEKLESEAGRVRSEGWRWVETLPEFDYEARAQFGKLTPEALPLSAEQEAEIEALESEMASLEDMEDEDAAWERQTEIEKRLEALQPESRFTPEQMALGGAVVSLAYNGELLIERGLLREEDVEAASGEDAPKEKTPGLPASLIESLTAHKTAIIASTLAEQPRVALAAVAHGLALRRFSREKGYYGAVGCLQLSLTSPSLKLAELSEAHQALEAKRVYWSERLPDEAGQLWDWCLAQSQEVLLDLLAVCAALSCNAIRQKQDRAGSDRLQHADALSTALGIDMRQRFTPTAANCFGKVSKPMMLSAYTEATGNPAPASWNGLKKGALAAAAEREISPTGWLPEPLRIAALA